MSYAALRPRYFFFRRLRLPPARADACPPLTRGLEVRAQARNFGTDCAATWISAPVAGLRAVRAGRSLFSKTPKPVIATLSPLATADWMVSRTAFSASVADFLSPRRPEMRVDQITLVHYSLLRSPTGGRGRACRLDRDP